MQVIFVFIQWYGPFLIFFLHVCVFVCVGEQEIRPRPRCSHSLIFFSLRQCCWFSSDGRLLFIAVTLWLCCCPRDRWIKPTVALCAVQVQRCGTPCVKKRLGWRGNWGWVPPGTPTTSCLYLFFCFFFKCLASCFKRLKINLNRNVLIFTFGHRLVPTCTLVLTAEAYVRDGVHFPPELVSSPGFSS